MKKFIIKLKKAHDATGLTPYAVSKQVDTSYNTVRKYVLSEQVEVEYLPMEVLMLTEFYGLDWRDPDVIELIEEGSDEEELLGQRETPLAAAI